MDLRHAPRWALARLPSKIIIDSVVLIGYINRGGPQHSVAQQALDYLLRRPDSIDNLFYNAVVEAESWPGASNAVTRRWIGDVLGAMVRLEIDGSVARRGGDLARIITKTIREQHGPTSKELYKRDPVTREWQPDWKLGDALIAASAERAKAAILTNNKDFEYLRNVVHVPIIQFGQIEIA